MTITYLLAGIGWGLVLLCLVKYLTDNGRFWLNNDDPQALDRNEGGGLQRSRNPQAAMRANTNSPLLNSGQNLYLDKAPPKPIELFSCGNNEVDPYYGPGRREYELDTIIIDSLVDSIKDSPEIVVSESESCQVLDKVEVG